MKDRSAGLYLRCPLSPASELPAPGAGRPRDARRGAEDHARFVTRVLIQRVLVKPGQARGCFELGLEGEIAAMVERRRQ